MQFKPPCSLLAALLLLATAACSSEGGEDEQPDATAGNAADAGAVDANSACASSTLTYTNFGESFMADYCLGCHSETAVNRRGAPANVNFDDFSLVESQKERIRARAGASQSMPPGLGVAKPSDDERASLVEWIDCGPMN